jgi:EAL domain-containing protein (putative c-di-GMP-specific phosphodiesterase class I)
MRKHFLQPVFQPISALSGETYAYEALMRFHQAPDKSPLTFVKRMEQLGQIHIVDHCMVNRLTDMMSLAPKNDLKLAVNVSIATIERLGDTYLHQLGQLARHIGQVVVEITETAPISNLRAILHFAQRCRENRFQVVLDDCRPDHPFCSSTLISLLEPDMVKIDGAFLLDCASKNDKNAVSALVSRAHDHQAAVVGEHISSLDVLNFAIGCGVDYLQGYAVGMPAPLPAS